MLKCSNLGKAPSSLPLGILVDRGVAIAGPTCRWSSDWLPVDLVVASFLDDLGLPGGMCDDPIWQGTAVTHAWATGGWSPLLNFMVRTKNQSAVDCELEECRPKTKEEEMQIKCTTESIKSDCDTNTKGNERFFVSMAPTSSSWSRLDLQRQQMHHLRLLPPPPKTTRSPSSPQWGWRGQV
jgi:hypothetical protein